MSLIDLTISPRDRDLGGFSVRRILPAVERRMVGPFVFLDHMGPAEFSAGQGMDVRPHPHIGLATVTYLFTGEIIHRDSLGSDIAIKPRAVNWMTAGGGIAHSERTGADERARPHETHGLQSWVALPREFEEAAPEFHHHAADTLPEFESQGVTFRVVAGSAFGHEAPVKIYSPLFYVEARMAAGASFVMPKQYADRALYLVEGRLRVGQAEIEPRTMPVFAHGETIKVEALAPSRAMLLGGDPLPEQRFIDWNFVSSSRERIEQAKTDWRAGKFPKVPGDDVEFIPLP